MIPHSESLLVSKDWHHGDYIFPDITKEPAVLFLLTLIPYPNEASRTQGQSSLVIGGASTLQLEA